MKRSPPRAFLLSIALAASSGFACRHPARDAPLTVVGSSDVLTLDPNEKFEVVTDTVAMNLFDPLLRFNGHMALEPALADRWTNPDERTWRLHLRSGVVFHDGTPLSSSDVVFSFERLLARPQSEVFPFLASIERVRAADGETVEFVTRHATPLLWRLSLVYVLPEKRLKAEGATAFFEHPVGTGAYRFLRRVPGDRIELEAFARFWAGAPRMPRVTFRAISSAEERWRLVGSGERVLLMSAPEAGWSEHLGDRRLRLLLRPSLQVSYLGLDLRPREGNPLADWRVRQAIRLALDLPEIVSSGKANHAYPASQYVPPSVIGYNPELSIAAPDRAHARRLLQEAGYGQGFALALDHQPDSRAVVSPLVRQLSEVGIRVTARSWPGGTFLERIDRGESGLHLAGWVCSSGESSELFEFAFHTREPQKGLGRGNSGGYSNRELDRLTEQIISATDPAERVELEKRAMAVVLKDLPWIPLYVEEDRYAMSGDILWEPRADGEIWLPEVSVKP